MADAYDSSPYEQGELAPSPDRRHVQVNSEEERDELSLSPHGGDTFDDPEDITDDDKRMEEDGDDSESLDIKPPQMQAGRREKSHKHKHKEDKRREREKRHRDFADDKERFGHHRGSGREKHTLKDAREHIREKQREKERKRKEDEEREARKREESIRERERLERLERERQRERRMRDDRDHKSQEKKRWEDDRRMGSGKERRRHRRDDSRIRSRSRERHHRQGGQLGERSFEHDQRKVEEKATWRGPHTPEEEYLGGEGEDYREQYQEEVHGGEEGEHSEQELMEEPDLQLESQHQDSTPLSKSPSDSSSSRRRSRHSRSSFGSPQLEPDSPHSSDDHANNLKHKLKSKFDDQSASEDEDDDDDDDDEFLPVEEDGDKVYVEDSPVPSPEPSKLPNYYPAYMGCRSVEEFSCLNRIEEGTYGVVYRARDKNSSQIVALKRLKMEKEKEGFPVTSLREINTLLKAQHPNIVTVREIVVGSNMDKIYIVMDYVAHDLKSLMETMKQPFSIGETKSLMQQLLRAVAHLHDNWILHRDLKTSNLLLSHDGILKVGDFGLAREYGSPLKNYTPVVVTLWYRAPELLLNCKQYTTHIDMWSVGCIFAELLTLKPLWPGKSEVDQINRIFKDLGTPNEAIWPGVSELPGMKKINFTKYTYNVLRQRFGPYLTELGFSLLNKFLTYCPEKRGTAEECLKDEFFEEAPLPTDPNMFPTWPAKSEQQPRKHASSPRPPSGGKAYAKLLGDDDDTVAGFHMGNAHKGASAQGHGFQLKF